MAVKCMFYVQEVAKTAAGAGRVKMAAVAKGPYAEWSHYTPSGTFEIVTLNEAATGWFADRLGSDVSITIEDPEVE